MLQVALGSNTFRLTYGWVPLKNANILSRSIFMQQNEAISPMTLRFPLGTTNTSSLAIQHKRSKTPVDHLFKYDLVSTLPLQTKSLVNIHTRLNFEVTTFLDIQLLLNTCMKFCISKTLYEPSHKFLQCYVS